MTAAAYLRCLGAVIARDAVRFSHQRARLLAALVRPLLWLIVFAAGFRSILGVSIVPPYETYITYDVYIIPGLVGMVQLFNGMQSSLSMVYDREMGSMRLMLTSPLPRWWLLFSKLAAGCVISILQVYAFLAIAGLVVGGPEPWGYVLVLPVLVLTGLMLGALGLLLSSSIRQLENFAGVMNFVIFPMFFLSSALYPLWRMAETAHCGSGGLQASHSSFLSRWFGLRSMSATQRRFRMTANSFSHNVTENINTTIQPTKNTGMGRSA